MVSPTRTPLRMALAAALAVSLTVRPAPAAAQDDNVSLIRDTEIEDILHDDAAPLFDAAGLDAKSVHILLIGSSDLQAFAAPGTMAVYTGLILESKSPNQLQGVMAHEIGHLAGGHSARSDDMSHAGLKPFLLTMGLGVLAALAGNAEAGAVLAGNAGYFGTLGALGYSREQESRADQAGATYLEKAGLSGRGLVEFFDNFRYQEVFQEARRFPYFRSHPLSSDRIEALRARVEKLPHYAQVDTPEAMAKHAIMKAKLQGFINPTIAMAKCGDKDQDYPTQYACAIAYYQLREPDKALKRLETMLADQPNNPYLWELKGQILFEFARAPEAEAPQRKSVALKPDAPLLRVNLGQTLIALPDKAKIEEGVQELKKSLDQDGDNAVAWRLLAEAYATQGKDGLARYATAEYNDRIGDKRQALIFAMRARDMLDKHSPEWRRATDIARTSNPDKDTYKGLDKDDRM
ncbi:M48 family metalloprotease [Phenylobacterium aquaticum]|uniref:M48 family metalloprotease n=1 Tax=Phenylobacterium aquaticum TaxID=1763816 RepID=UPI003AFABE5B